MRRTLIAFAAAALAAVSASPAAAQNGHRGVIAAQLDTVTSVKTREGFAAERVVDGNTVIGMMANGGSVVLEVNLRAGTQYFIPAGCDADCNDLDLRVHSPDGETVLDEDVEADDVPIVSFTAARSGPHLLTVMMSSCKTSLCYFGFRVLGKR
jgi:hypothetical protein